MLCGSLIWGLKCCGLEDKFIWFVLCSSSFFGVRLIGKWSYGVMSFVLSARLVSCWPRWCIFWFEYALVAVCGCWHGSHRGVWRSTLAWEDCFGLTSWRATLFIYKFHLMLTLEDVLECAVHWNHLKRMCCDVFWSTLSPGLDQNGCYRSKWPNLCDFVYFVYRPPSLGFQWIILYIYECGCMRWVWDVFEFMWSGLEWCASKFGIAEVRKTIVKSIEI